MICPSNPINPLLCFRFLGSLHLQTQLLFAVVRMETQLSAEKQEKSSTCMYSVYFCESKLAVLRE
jgi:hypothetical protein